MHGIITVQRSRRPRDLGVTLFACAWIGLLAPSAMAQTSTQPTKPAATAPAAGGSKILNRNKTKLKPIPVKESSKTPARDNASKPNGGIKPTGQNRTYADPIVQLPGTAALTRSGTPSAFAPDTTSDDLVISPILDKPAVGPLARNKDVREKIVARAQEKNVVPTIDDIRQIAVKGTSTEDEKKFEEARQKYLAQGYMEGEVDDTRVVFIKTDNWCKFHMVLDDIKQTYGTGTVSETHAPNYDGYRSADDVFYRSDFVYGSDFTGSPGDSSPSSTCTNGTCGARKAKDTRRPVPSTGVDSFVAEVTLDHPLDDGSDPVATLTPFEQATASLQDGNAPAAIKQLQALLVADAEDAEAIRLLGLALLRNGKLSGGITRMFEAYTLNPALASVPIDPAVLKDGNTNLRDMAQRVVTIANKSKDPDASVVAAALFQAQGKNDAARRMMDKAREKGLKGSLVSEFDLTLSTTVTKSK